VRNWAKIDRFTEALRALPAVDATLPASPNGVGDFDFELDSDEDPLAAGGAERSSKVEARKGPKHYDIIGDVAVLSTMPGNADKAAIGAEILKDNGKIRVVVARCGALQGALRAPIFLEILAGPDRKPLMTTHTEFGVRCVVNLQAAFFNPRMGPERQRICGQVQADEEVCVLFAGCCPEALQIAAKTEARYVVAIELNAEAVQCAGRSLELLGKRSPERAARVSVLQGDVRTFVRDLPQGSFHRVLAPRPKGKTDEEDGQLVDEFLDCLLPLLRPGGICHWYDFVADWEFPTCERSTSRISQAVARSGRTCTVIRCAAANNKPVAQRQYRMVIDFAVS